MKKYPVITLLFLLIVFLFLSCYEGFTGPDGEMLVQYLEPEALKQLTENPQEDIWIIDVRPASAYKAGYIPSAKSFPSSEIMNRLSKLSKEQYLIIYCETGGRAQMVLKDLLEKGYTRLINWGGVGRWKWELKKIL